MAKRRAKKQNKVSDSERAKRKAWANHREWDERKWWKEPNNSTTGQGEKENKPRGSADGYYHWLIGKGYSASKALEMVAKRYGSN